MIEWDGGWLVLGKDGELYHVEHVWTTWSVRRAYVDLGLSEDVIQEPWDKVRREKRY